MRPCFLDNPAGRAVDMWQLVNVPTPTAVGRVRFSPLFVCLSVCRHDISKTDAASITNVDVEIFYDESWKPTEFWVKGQGHESQNRCRRGSLHSSECRLLLVGYVVVVDRDDDDDYYYFLVGVCYDVDRASGGQLGRWAASVGYQDAVGVPADVRR